MARTTRTSPTTYRPQHTIQPPTSNHPQNNNTLSPTSNNSNALKNSEMVDDLGRLQASFGRHQLGAFVWISLCRGGGRRKWSLLENVGRGNGQKRQLFPRSSIVKLSYIFSHRMSSHAQLGSPTTHLIPEVYVNATTANMMSIDIVVDLEHNCISSRMQQWCRTRYCIQRMKIETMIF